MPASRATTCSAISRSVATSEGEEMKTRTRAGSATIIAARTIPAGRKDGHAAHVIRCASCNTAQYSTCRVPEQTNERSNCWPDSAYVLTWMKRRVATWKKALRRSAPGLIANKPSVVAQRERQRAQRQHRAPRQLSRLDVHRRERRPRWPASSDWTRASATRWRCPGSLARAAPPWQDKRGMLHQSPAAAAVAQCGRLPPPPGGASQARSVARDCRTRRSARRGP